ncbi:MAG: tRNA (adenosine(37)-N6)-dimethylallyltransferase MiaA [Pseudomonadota bacterium]
MSDILVIAGPTASGKSAVALDLAREMDGEIINADAMQVYEDLRILTARPSKQDEAAVPHHLYGVSAGDDPWSAGRFARQASEVIETVIRRGRFPIVVGGTGLWLRALTKGLSPIPAISPEVEAAAQARLEALGMAGFRAEVLSVDPVMDRLEPNDRQRHLRAWMVHQATGRPLSVWQETPPQPVTNRSITRIALVPPRDLSHDAVEQRFFRMLKSGALEEVEALITRNYSPSLPVMKSLGVPELAAYLQGHLTEGQAVERAVIATRQLVKRQTTWLNGQFSVWPRAATPKDLCTLARAQLANRPPASA